MKKPVKLSVIIVSCVVAAVAVAVLVLSLVRINPIERLPENYSVDVYAPSATDRLAANDETRAKVTSAIADSSYSIMHAMLEYRFDYSFNFKTQKNEVGDTERVKIYAKDIAGYMSATADAYMLELAYAQPVSVKVDGDTVTFDRVRFLVGRHVRRDRKGRNALLRERENRQRADRRVLLRHARRGVDGQLQPVRRAGRTDRSAVRRLYG